MSQELVIQPPHTANHRHTLLATRLHPPPLRPLIVQRPHLTEQLDVGLLVPCMVISAPAGYGKTTLLSEWVRTISLPVAWLSLDESDNDFIRFVEYLCAALQTIDAEVGLATLGILLDAPDMPVQAVMTSLINDVALITTDFVLILDDYHVIEGDSMMAQPVHEAMSFLIDHVPPPMHLVIASRSDPPLPLARLRARGQLTELSARDLRFSADEAATFLNQIMGLTLSETDVVALMTRTEGWIAGLQLAALSLQKCHDMGDFIAAFAGTHRYILDYLTEEVFQRQPLAIQDFLIQTAILKRLCGPLCAAVTGQSNSAAILARLDTDHLFVVPLDDQRRWYRYHHLFADLLQVRLRELWPDQVSGLHRRASDWFEQAGMIAEAIEHAHLAGDLDHQLQLIGTHSWSFGMRGEVNTVRGWIEALPDEVVRSHPRLAISYVWTLTLLGKTDMVESWLDDIEHTLIEHVSEFSAEDIDRFSAQVAIFRSCLASMCLGPAYALELAQQALDRVPESDYFLRGIIAIRLGGIAWEAGDMVRAIHCYDQSIWLCLRTQNIVTAMMATHHLVEALQVQGRLHRAADVCQHVLEKLAQSAETTEELPPAIGMVYVGLGMVLYEWDELEEAERHLRRGLAIGKAGGFVDVLAFGETELARVLLARGDVAGARNLMRKPHQIVRDLPIWRHSTAIGVCLARMNLRQRNTAVAVNWLQQRGLEVTHEPHPAHELEYIALVHLLVVQGQSDPAGPYLPDAFTLIAPLLNAAEVGDRIGYVIELLLLQALAFQALGQLDQALDSLERALQLAEPEGYVRVFVDGGQPMANLLYTAVDQDILPAYAGRLLAAFPVENVSPAGHPTRQPDRTDLIEPLTERELEVLSLIAEGLSNREVAQRLHLSLSTVKVHTSNIYGKLSVNRRTQAVARARGWGILPPD